jgi:pimeloyl-ACP methyl ester carboxylesterase
VIEHSAGGTLGLFYAAAHPASVAALVLISTGHVVWEADNAVTDNALMRLCPGERQQLEELGKSTAGTPDERIAARLKLMAPGYFFDRDKAAGMVAAMKPDFVHADTMRLLMRDMLYPGMDLRPALKDFARPTLVIAGRQDPLDPKVQYEIHLALKDSTLELIPPHPGSSNQAVLPGRRSAPGEALVRQRIPGGRLSGDASGGSARCTRS